MTRPSTDLGIAFVADRFVAIAGRAEVPGGSVIILFKTTKNL